MILIVWTVAASVCMFGWLIVWDEVNAPQPWHRRAFIVIGWACVTWAIVAAFPF